MLMDSRVDADVDTDFEDKQRRSLARLTRHDFHDRRRRASRRTEATLKITRPPFENEAGM